MGSRANTFHQANTSNNGRLSGKLKLNLILILFYAFISYSSRNCQAASNRLARQNHLTAREAAYLVAQTEATLLPQVELKTGGAEVESATASTKAKPCGLKEGENWQQHSNVANAIETSSLSALSGNEKQDQIDEDVVISSSEILIDNTKHSTTTTTSQRTTTATTNCSSAQLIDRFSSSNSIQLSTNDKDEQVYSNSRLILRVLVVGLFALVSISLVVLYAIKLCICRRRKRLLRRNIIADANDEPQAFESNSFGLTSGSCRSGTRVGSSQTNVGFFAHPIRRLLHLFASPSSSSAAACSSSALPPAPINSQQHGHQSIIPSIYAQLSLAERYALSQIAGNFPAPPPPPNNMPPHSTCSICLSVAPGNENSSLAMNQRTNLLRPPPAYSELFGGSSSGRSPSNSNESETCREYSSSTNSNSNSNENETISAANAEGEESQGSQQRGQQQQQEQKNLLVKLNLNKTKLLSAQDLLLLSKLIDVPIIVQNQATNNSNNNTNNANLANDAANNVNEDNSCQDNSNEFDSSIVINESQATSDFRLRRYELNDDDYEEE